MRGEIQLDRKDIQAGGDPFSEAEYNRRYEAIYRVLDDRGLDGVICYGNRGHPGLIPYLSNFTPRWEAFLLVLRQGDRVLWVQLYNHLPSAQKVSILPDTRWGGEDSVQAAAAELSRRNLAAKKLGLAGAIPYQRYESLQTALPHAEFLDLSRALEKLRWVKSEEELDRMRRAAALTDLALTALVEGVCPGLTEIDLRRIMQAAVQAEGGELELLYLSSTSMENPDVCVPAQNLTNRRIQRGDVIITEIGAASGGYAGQIHRPVSIDMKPNQAYERLFDVALEAYHRIVSAIQPGATERDVLNAAEIIHQEGYSIYDDLVHGFGGGYLPPVLRTRQTRIGRIEPFVFQKNMCIVVQPNVISLDQRMGIQLGQLHVLTEEGLESLQQHPLTFIVREVG